MHFQRLLCDWVWIRAGACEACVDPAGGTWGWDRAALPDILVGRGKVLEEPVEPEILPGPFLENSTVTVCPRGWVEMYFNVLAC